MKDKVYWSGVEYTYEYGSPDYGRLKGGFVYIFARAFDVREALDKILTDLKNHDIAPVEIEFISPYDKEMEWEEESQKKRYMELYNTALKSEQVIFDDFYAYEKEE